MNSDSNAYTMEHNSDYDFEQDFMEEEEEESQQSRQEQLQDMSFRDSSVTTTTTTTHSKTDSKKQGLDQAELRKKIIEIQQNTSIDSKQKAQKVQYLMSHGVPPPTDATSPTKSTSEKEDTGRGYGLTYQNKAKNILGCKHYQRNCKLEANCCKEIFPCRFCHDEASDHAIVRNETKNMLCMLCQTFQPAGQDCNKCGEQLARYYCDKCKLWDHDPKKQIYHCDDCGICRQGKGLGEDFFHCKTCNVCMIILMKEKHRCIERNLESDCPICGEYMFTSTDTVIFMTCGHCIHRHCYKAYIQTAYQCPTCLKSLYNMKNYFNRLDRELERQPMPSEYEKYMSHIFCNDCEQKSSAKYHFFYHKCGPCGSYNTTVLKTENKEETVELVEPVEPDDRQEEASGSLSSVATSETLAGTLQYSGNEQDLGPSPQAGNLANLFLGALSSLNLREPSTNNPSSSASDSASRSEN